MAKKRDCSPIFPRSTGIRHTNPKPRRGLQQSPCDRSTRTKPHSQDAVGPDARLSRPYSCRQSLHVEFTHCRYNPHNLSAPSALRKCPCGLLRIGFVIGVACLSGCTSGRLRQRTINQAGTLPELQYQQVLDNLGQFAANPALLPWHINLREGTSQVTDSLSGGETLDPDHRSAGSLSFLARGRPWPSGGCLR